MLLETHKCFESLLALPLVVALALRGRQVELGTCGEPRTTLAALTALDRIRRACGASHGAHPRSHKTQDPACQLQWEQGMSLELQY